MAGYAILVAKRCMSITPVIAAGLDSITLCMVSLVDEYLFNGNVKYAARS